MKTLTILSCLLGLTFSSVAIAQEQSKPLRPIIDITPQEPKHKNFGFGFDVGAPDGVGINFVVRPNVDWLRADIGVTYNVISPGIRGGLTLDPINFIIAPSFTIDGGYTFMGNIPGKSTQLDLTYVNFHPGIEIGSRKSFRFFIHAGPSYLYSTGNHVDNLLGNKSTEFKLYNTSVSGWFTPTAKLGFVILL